MYGCYYDFLCLFFNVILILKLLKLYVQGREFIVNISFYEFYRSQPLLMFTI